MTLTRLDRMILDEAREVTGNPNLRNMNIMEWSSGEIKPHEGEKVYHLPKLGLNISVKEG